jgi:hypothetical protein
MQVIFEKFQTFATYQSFICTVFLKTREEDNIFLEKHLYRYNPTHLCPSIKLVVRTYFLWQTVLRNLDNK